MDKLKKIQWMTDETIYASGSETSDYIPRYGDVTELNTCRLIMDSVGPKLLKEIGRQSINLLETSVAIYEANGDYAFGMFSSGWCQIMDAASRALCQTDDNRVALSCGRWLCHENCWNDSAKQAIKTGKSTDIECVGGIRLYAEPIYAGQRVIGAINIGYGDPPGSFDTLTTLADSFHVTPETLKEIGDKYKSRPGFVVDAAKKLLRSFAQLIGEIVEKTEAQQKQQEIQEQEAHLINVLKAIRNVNQLIVKENNPERLVQKGCEELSNTMGYYNAWIALLDEDSQHVTLTGESGFNGGFKAMEERLKQGRFPSCMRRTLERRELVVIDDPSTQCPDCPLAEHYQYQGRSAFTHTLKNFGILSVSVPAHFAHDPEEQELFVEVANDLAFALFKIETQKEIHRKNHIIQTTPHPMSLVSRDYRYLAVNKAYSRFYNKTSDKIIGRPITDFLDPEVFEQEIKPRLDRCLNGEILHYEAFVEFPGTGPRWMRMEYTPYRNRENRIVGVVSHGLDITESKQTEKERGRLEDRLTQAQKMESIGTVAGGIAHDFNNILFPIVGMAELLMEDLPEGGVEYENVRAILTAGRRGADLVKQILAFSRQTEHQMSAVKIQYVIKEALKLLRSTLPSYIEIHQDIKTDCGLIKADPTQIYQVIMNIITNAFHAVETKGGNISVSLRETPLELSDVSGKDIPPGRYVILSVSDTGNGILPQHMDKIFDPYFTTKKQGKGTGLGLSVVYGIVKEHQGDITVYSEIGKGTTFNVYLPVIQEKSSSDPKNKIQTLPTGHERILLVDDEDVIAKLEAHMLERLGYRVTRHVNSMEALVAFTLSPDSFDLILSDMNMPTMTGLQLAGEVNSTRPDMPVIICTGFSDKIEDKSAEMPGVKAILKKPMVMSELAETVRTVLDGNNNET
ncbi:MAG: ATP-binding protein [Desulfobacteraceae bacterium]